MIASVVVSADGVYKVDCGGCRGRTELHFPTQREASEALIKHLAEVHGVVADRPFHKFS